MKTVLLAMLSLLSFTDSRRLICPEECRCEIPLDCSRASPETNSLDISGMDLAETLSHPTVNPFPGLQKLRLLNLTANGITVVQAHIFHPLVNLQELRMDDNKLRDLETRTFNENRELHLLGLNGNPLGSAPILQAPFLDWLEMDRCNITFLPQNAFDSSSNIMYLSMDHNQLVTLPKQVFRPLVKLSYLRMRHNLLTNISPHTFRDNNMLQMLSLDYNPLLLPKRGPFLMSSSLLVLHLTYCNISHLPVDAFSRLPLLRSLNLSNNHLTFVTAEVFSNLTELKVLDLRWNRLTGLDLRIFGERKVTTELFIDLQYNTLLCTCNLFHCYKHPRRCSMHNVSFNITCKDEEEKLCNLGSYPNVNVSSLAEVIVDENYTDLLVPKLKPFVVEAHPTVPIAIGGSILLLMAMILLSVLIQKYRKCNKHRKHNDNLEEATPSCVKNAPLQPHECTLLSAEEQLCSSPSQNLQRKLPP